MTEENTTRAETLTAEAVAILESAGLSPDRSKDEFDKSVLEAKGDDQALALAEEISRFIKAAFIEFPEVRGSENCESIKSLELHQMIVDRLSLVLCRVSKQLCGHFAILHTDGTYKVLTPKMVEEKKAA